MVKEHSMTTFAPTEEAVGECGEDRKPSELGVKKVYVCETISNRVANRWIALVLSEEMSVFVCVCAGKKRVLLMNLITDLQTGSGMSRWVSK